jgi:hypothetical protein
MMLLLEWNFSIKLNDRSLLDVYFDDSVCAVHTHTHTHTQYIYVCVRVLTRFSALLYCNLMLPEEYSY